ncbi:hypothetical protein C5167_029261 [Papaver somniferum]|nr:hypothetical protein C5167_029261 [Papaver somniferum]
MSERNNNMLLKSQLESTVKENFELESRVSGMVELNKENSVMKHVFKMEQEEYNKEKKPIGINALLDEAW